MSAPAEPKLKTILYLCDDPNLGAVRARVLEREGYVVVTADVQEGRKHWRERRRNFDLVLFEILGNPRDALDLCDEIKSDTPDQLYAVLASSRTYFSGEACPDEILHKDDGPRSVVEQVNLLLSEA